MTVVENFDSLLYAGPGRGRWLLVGAAVVTLAIYAIPHSLHGSTLDYQTMQTVSG